MSHFLSKTLYFNREAELFRILRTSSCSSTVVQVLYCSTSTLSLTRGKVSSYLHILSQYWKFVKVQRSDFRCMSVNVLLYNAKVWGDLPYLTLPLKALLCPVKPAAPSVLSKKKKLSKQYVLKKQNNSEAYSTCQLFWSAVYKIFIADFFRAIFRRQKR